ncbi:hypothetical protein BCV72DRAFT_337782 [Rhizopus microsporus var. microsporus]|uniref:Uncharacterized protein n=2 Tax=Rhizopus microsporus TaxID=58291 RepID=A0A2G4T2Z4_RHIZD|nr:uncharacterized protein RHIMIDRAFT_289810 [Rhizopus microsporus ATCC 52813]ORE03724.1 hypothetical protein BCV72DRAFT_337782 [Rhizopus microsporus var. microsporus]PHZ15391.1 hypothetical protein RHIMIDRAFT_289810 [Rhizopus microsporus ATCC 52813]
MTHIKHVRRDTFDTINATISSTMETLFRHLYPPQAQLHTFWSESSRLSITSNGMAIVSHFTPAATTSIGPSDNGLLRIRQKLLTASDSRVGSLPVFPMESHSSSSAKDSPRTVFGRANHPRTMNDSEAPRTSSARKQQRESATEESELETSRLELRRLRLFTDGLDDDVQTIILRLNSQTSKSKNCSPAQWCVSILEL